MQPHRRGSSKWGGQLALVAAGLLVVAFVMLLAPHYTLHMHHIQQHSSTLHTSTPAGVNLGQVQLPKSHPPLVVDRSAVSYDGISIEPPPAIRNGSVTYKQVLASLKGVAQHKVCPPYKTGLCVTLVTDNAISYHDHVVNGIELQVGKQFVDTLSKSNPATDVVIDVGMNGGYFTLLPAAMGFRVHAFEPQPACVALMKETLTLQPDLAKLVVLHNAALGAPLPPDSEPPAFDVHYSECHGGYSWPDTWKGNRPLVSIPVRVLSDYLAASDKVAVLKLDVEANEVPVLEGVLGPLLEGRVRTLLVELKVSAWPSKGVPIARGLKVFEALLQRASSVTVLPNIPIKTLKDIEKECERNCDMMLKFN